VPVGDWQFWVVTLAAAMGLAVLLRSAWPRRKGSKAELTVSAERDEARGAGRE